MRIHRQRGFTLIELVVALIIISLLIAWGIPNYRNLKLRQDFTSYANEAIYSINLARAEAIRRGTNVAIIKAGGDWDDGWQVVIVADGTVLAEQDPFSGGFEMNLTAGAEADLEFDNLGGLINQPVTFELSHDDYTGGRRIQLLASGQARGGDHMKQTNLKKKTESQGFTLLEILIAILVFSFGLLGLAGMMTISVRNNHNGYLRTQANFFADNMADRMRANPVALWNGSYSGTAAPGATVCSLASPCDFDTLARYDMENWARSIANTLPSRSGVISPVLVQVVCRAIYHQQMPPLFGFPRRLIQVCVRLMSLGQRLMATPERTINQ